MFILSAAAGAGLALGTVCAAPEKVDPRLRERAIAQGHTKAWVYFTDKGVGPRDRAASLGAAEAALSPQARTRRLLRRTDPGLVDDRDIAVAAAYVDAVRAAGAEPHVRSRWLNAASVRVDAADLDRIAALPFVSRLTPVAGAAGSAPVGPPGAPGVLRGPPPYHGLAEEQLTQIGVVAMHNLGFTGQGVIIGVLDTGFLRTHTAFNGPEFPLQVVAERDFINDDANTANEPGDHPAQHDHGTYILGTMAAHAPGALVGAAYRARYVLCKTEDVASETPVEEDNYVAGLEFAELHGADVVTSSLRYSDWYNANDYDGRTAVTTIAVNIATSQGVVCVTAAGNAGHDGDPASGHLGVPADAFKVLTCGAVLNDGGTAWFSSDGPTADGRIKPELLARGYETATVAIGNPNDYAAVSGTSLSTPLVAGAAACLVQARPTWSVDKVCGHLLTSADAYMASGTTDPLFIRGYGIMGVAVAMAEDCNRNGTPDPQDIAAGLERDCNGNGLADSCDIAVGLSLDADLNGVPDECVACPADWNGDEAVNSTDISAYLTDWLASVTGGTLDADFSGDGTVNSSDISAFLTAWLAALGGC